MAMDLQQGVAGWSGDYFKPMRKGPHCGEQGSKASVVMPLVSSLAAEDVSLTSGGRAGFLSGGLVIFVFAHMLVLGKARLPIRREGKVFSFFHRPVWAV
jgi:hypothetical protein